MKSIYTSSNIRVFEIWTLNLLSTTFVKSSVPQSFKDFLELFDLSDDKMHSTTKPFSNKLEAPFNSKQSQRFLH